MAALINKRTTDSRYVSVFADSVPDVDITFMVPFLQRPTDHYLVGVDNLTISLSALGLLEHNSNPIKNIILRVMRRRRNGNLPATDIPEGDFYDVDLPKAGVFSQDLLGFQILTLNEFMLTLDSFGSAVGDYIEYNLAGKYDDNGGLLHLEIPCQVCGHQ